MATVKHFEELVAWQRARALTKEIYAISDKGAFARDFGFKDQIRRASVSIMSNIAEGFEYQSAAMLRRALEIASGSAGEVRSQLYVALDSGYIDQSEFDALQALAIETSRLIRGFYKSIRLSSNS